MTPVTLQWPGVPHGWYYVAPVERMARPLQVRLGERTFVAYRSGRELHVLDGRCAHFGAFLARGRVADGCLECPLHGWRYTGDGRCVATPSGERAPEAARLVAYRTATVGGHLFFHTDPQVRGAVPFFPEVSPDALVSAPPFAFDVEMPWWMVTTNGFDTQHFLTAHDRQLVAPPEVLREDDVFEARAAFDVRPGGWRDLATRLLAGRRTEMTVRSAGGSLVLVRSRFRRAETFGLVSVHPRGAERSHVRVVVWMRSRRGLRRAFDALDVRVRASFIRAFIQPDIEAGAGIRFDAARALDADALVSRYLRWQAARCAVQGAPG